MGKTEQERQIKDLQTQIWRCEQIIQKKRCEMVGWEVEKMKLEKKLEEMRKN